MKTIEILDDMGHRIELGQVPEEDVERACGVIDSLAITGEAVTPVLTAAAAGIPGPVRNPAAGRMTP